MLIRTIEMTDFAEADDYDALARAEPPIEMHPDVFHAPQEPRSHWEQCDADALRSTYEVVLGETSTVSERIIVDERAAEPYWPLDLDPDTLRSRDAIANVAVDRAHHDIWPTPTGITRGPTLQWHVGLDEDAYDYFY